jgi:hypothetical protein
MQENQSAPRIADAHAATNAACCLGSKGADVKVRLTGIRQWRRVVIRWIFRLSGLTEPRRNEELAYQRWVGERIAEETFFYDPATRTQEARKRSGPPIMPVSGVKALFDVFGTLVD